MPAARLAELRVFEPAPRFFPDRAVTVIEAVRGIFLTAQQDVGDLEDDTLASRAVSSRLSEPGAFSDFYKEITVAELCYLADRACLDIENAEQYELLAENYEQTPERFKNSFLQAVALGLIDYEETDPGAVVTRALLAQVLYRLYNPGARLILPFYLSGTAPDSGEYIIKTSLSHNPGGISFGLYSNYNHQDDAFSYFGKRPVDRTDFYKWSLIEKEKGVYTWPSFNNCLSAHRAGSTIICNVDISANLKTNPYLSGGSRIPDFYSQDITDNETRTAAKEFLRQFVIKYLNTVKGDVMLAIDYEIDFQQGITGANQAAKAERFAEWYVEACETARAAAASIDAADRLKIICIYNNITNLHLMGKEYNAWALKVSGASDIVGIDTYQSYENDPASPNYTLQNIRYLINNFSCGKPVYVVENGVDGEWGDSASLETQALYWKNLFREFSFALEKGDYLNRNLSGFLAWSLFDTSADTSKGLLTQNGKSAKPALAAVQEGISRLERQRQFNPSVFQSSEIFTEGDITVKSGTDYDKLTFIKTDLKSTSVTFRVELEVPGTVMLSVNGKTHIYSESTKYHFIQLDDVLEKGFNYIDIYFGADKTPFTQTVKSVTLIS